MKQVSRAYSESMKSTLRNRSYVKVTLQCGGSDAGEDGAWSNNGQMSFSSLDIDKGTLSGDTRATLELNRWTLDGTGAIDDTADGFVSSEISAEDGTFATAAVLTKTFTTPHAIPGLTLAFDTRSNEWPKRIEAAFYLDNEIVESVAIFPTSATTSVETNINKCDRVTITFLEMLPYRRPRIESVTFAPQKYFYNEDILSVKQSHDVDPLSRRLPKENFVFSIVDYDKKYDPNNPKGAYKYIDEQSPVSVQYGYDLPDGTREWIKADHYTLTSRPTTSKGKAEFTATGLIGSLTGTYYKGKVGTKTFYDMAEDVLKDAGTRLSWVIDPSLKSMSTTAVMPIDTHANCLQLIAHACRCELYTDDDNIIHIEPFGVTKTGVYSGAYSDNGHVPFSSWDSVETGATGDVTYITLEPNRWILGGDQVIAPDADGYDGYISSQMSGEEGTFAENPTFTRTFDEAINCRTVSFHFGKDYPQKIQVDFYAGEELLDTALADVDEENIIVTSNLADACTKIVVSCVKTAPYSRFRVERIFFSEADLSIDFSTISQGSQSMKKIDKLKAVSVAKYTYTPDALSSLFDDETSEENLHVEFNAAQDVTVTVTDGTLLSSAIYGRAADLVLSSGTKRVLIEGKPLKESTTTHTRSVNTDGAVDTEKNPLITSMEMAQALAEHVAEYLQMRNTYDVSYRGNPELETGDIIAIATDYTKAMDALVLTDEITFDGSLRGKLKVKALI